jgi:hypothetical protein
MALGSFAGGLAKGFTGTYGLLSDIEEKKEEREERRQKRLREQQAREAARQTIGRIGTESDFTQSVQETAGVGPQQARAIQAGTGDVEFDRAVAQSATDVMRENAMRQGAIPVDQTAAPLQGRTYTESQAYEDYARALAGIDPDKAFDMRLKGLQLDDILTTRKEKAEFRKWRDGFNTQLSAAQDLAALAETDEAGFIAGAKKFGVDIRPISIGGGKMAYEAYSGGQKVGQYSDLQSAAQDGMAAFTNNLLVQGAARFATTPEQFVSILSTADKLQNDRRRLGIEERGMALREREEGSQANLRRAQTDLIYKQIGQIDEKGAARDAAKPFVDAYMNLSPEEQSGPKGFELLGKAAVAAATKSGDFATASKSTPYGSALETYKKAVEAAAKEGTPPPNFAQFMGGQGFAPDAVTKGQQKKVDDLVAAGKRTQAQEIVNQHNAAFFRTPIRMPEGGAALPPTSQRQTEAVSGRRTAQRPGQGIVLESPFVRESVGGRSAQAQRRRAIED